MKFSIEDGVEKVNSNVYGSFLGSLLYMIHTRPDIIFTKSLLPQFMEYSSKIHMGCKADIEIFEND